MFYISIMLIFWNSNKDPSVQLLLNDKLLVCDLVYENGAYVRKLVFKNTAVKSKQLGS